MVYIKILAWFIIAVFAALLFAYMVDSANSSNSTSLGDWGIAKDSPVR